MCDFCEELRKAEPKDLLEAYKRWLQRCGALTSKENHLLNTGFQLAGKDGWQYVPPKALQDWHKHTQNLKHEQESDPV